MRSSTPAKIRLALSLASVCGALLWAGAPAQADQVAVAQSWNGLGFGFCVSPNQSIASTFTPTASGQLKTVSVWLQSDVAARSVRAEILSANPDGSPGFTVLDGTDVAAAADPGVRVHEDTGDFVSGPMLSAGTEYVLALTSATNTCLPAWSFSNAGGTAWFSDPAQFDGWQQVAQIAGIDHQAFALSVSVDTPPDKPAAPSSDQSLNGDGHQTISWAPAVDHDGDAIDHYVLQHERSDQSSFSNIAHVSGTSYHLGTDGPSEDEGTWTYRVIAFDSHGTASDPSDPSTAVIVDKGAPKAPSAHVSAPAAYTDGTGRAWYRDAVTVSFTGNGDPTLADGSEGSGVASVTPSQTFDSTNVDPSTGAFSLDGTATDHADNVSAKTTATGNVDWGTPAASFSDCPTAPVLLNARGTIHWDASDPAPSSGLATPSSGSAPLNTSAAGSYRASSVAPSDDVGHTGTPASCTYTVDYSFSGFVPPVRSAPAINAGKAGRTYPIKWQLSDVNGHPVTALGAVRSITSKPTSCSAFSSDPSGATDAGATGGTSLRNDGGQYTYNWSTPRAGCYSFFLTLESGQVLPAYFQLS